MIEATVALIAITIGIATILYAMFGMRGASTSPGVPKMEGLWISNWKLPAINLKSPPFRRLISMQKAAKIAYEKTQGSVIASAAEHSAREMKEGYDGILNYYARALVGQGDDMELWGRRPPSTRLESIDGAQECPQCSFVGGGNCLKRHNDAEFRWIDIMVAKGPLRKRIKDIARLDR